VARRPLNVWSLFSGVGGFDLGLERAGMRVVLQCEKDPWRRKVLAARFPGVALFDDVCALRGESTVGGTRNGGRNVRGGAGGALRAEASADAPDLLCGGFPCQDVSTAGKRAGLAGERSGLFFEFARIAQETEPEWLLIENVPGLFSSAKGEDFHAVLDEVADIGYEDIAWRVLDSRFFGVAQRRRRVFIVARRGRGTSASEVLLESEGGAGSADEVEETRSVVPPVSLSGVGSGGPDDNDAQAGRLLAFHLTQDPISSSEFTPALSSGSPDKTNGVIGVAGYPNPAGPLTKRYEKGINTTIDDGAVIVQDGVIVRRLTPTECERLQGFPDGWTCLCDPTCSSLEPTCPVGKRVSAMGDAVTVPVIEWIGRRILGA